jgi:hypothetical protein
VTVDPVEHLIRAWTAWETAPSADWTAGAKEDAITAAGLAGIAAHHHIVAARHDGMSIPDAVQQLMNDTHTEAA